MIAESRTAKMINAREKGLGFRSSITSVTDHAHRLTLPGAVDPMQPNALSLAAVHDGDDLVSEERFRTGHYLGSSTRQRN